MASPCYGLLPAPDTRQFGLNLLNENYSGKYSERTHNPSSNSYSPYMDSHVLKITAILSLHARTEQFMILPNQKPFHLPPSLYTKHLCLPVHVNHSLCLTFMFLHCNSTLCWSSTSHTYKLLGRLDRQVKIIANQHPINTNRTEERQR